MKNFRKDKKEINTYQLWQQQLLANVPSLNKAVNIAKSLRANFQTELPSQTKKNNDYKHSFFVSAPSHTLCFSLVISKGKLSLLRACHEHKGRECLAMADLPPPKTNKQTNKNATANTTLNPPGKGKKHLNLTDFA